MLLLLLLLLLLLVMLNILQLAVFRLSSDFYWPGMICSPLNALSCVVLINFFHYNFIF